VRRPKTGPWRPEVVSTTCGYCGIGCNLEIAATGNTITEVSSPIYSVVNGGNLCHKGSFYPYSIHELDRVKTPLIKRNRQLVEIGWPEALSLAGEVLKQIRDRNGGGSLAVLASPQLTNEEQYIAQKLARVALKTNNIGYLTSPGAGESLMKSLGRDASTCSYNDILTSDLIMVFNCDLAEEYPVIALKVREAVASGSSLLSLNPRATRLDSIARATLRINRRISLDLLKTMLSHILTHDLVNHDFINSRTKGFQAFSKELKEYPPEDIASSYWVKPDKIIETIHLYTSARRPVIIINADTITPAELTLISDLALITGNIDRDGAGIIALRSGANTQGMIDMGAQANRLPGQRLITDATAREKLEDAWGNALPAEEGRGYAEMISGVERGEVQGVLVLGSDATGKMGNAIFEVPIFSVLVDAIMPEKPPYPSLILPGAHFVESEGTYTNCERRVQQLRHAVPPQGGKQNWEIISALSSSLGQPMDYPNVSSISKEIAEQVPLYRDITFNDQWPFTDDGRFEFDDGLARIQLPGREIWKQVANI
jgi:predicted molibdopterin-dependent oxidoreductase YjgC